MPYNPLKLGSATESKEALNVSLHKIDEMLADLFSSTPDLIDWNALNVSVVPAISNTYNLGTNENRWKDLFLQGTATITDIAIANEIIFSDNSRQRTAKNTLTSLDDVNIVDPLLGEVLKFNGEKWVNSIDNTGSGGGGSGTGDLTINTIFDTVELSTATAGQGIRINPNGAGLVSVVAPSITLTGKTVHSGNVVETVQDLAGLATGNVTLTLSEITGNILSGEPFVTDRDLILPDASIATAGQRLIIRNRSISFSITVKDTTANNTIVIILPNSQTEIYSDGLIWGVFETPTLTIPNSFSTVSVAGQSNIVADSTGDTLTFVAGTGISITTTPGSDSITITNTVSGGGASGTLASRSALTGVTPVLTSGQTANVTISGYKGYMLYKIYTSGAAWVRLYTSTEERSADVSRLQGQDPLPGAGVIAEVITTAPGEYLISPGAIGFSTEAPPDSNIPMLVTNLGTVDAEITVTLTAVQLEA